MRTGRKAVADHMVVYINRDGAQTHARFGFVVAKDVGVAVKRNLVKRRARSAIRERMQNFNSGEKVVIRALPGSAELDWREFSSELDYCLNKLSN
jgi:ribonuclease P protein component